MLYYIIFLTSMLASLVPPKQSIDDSRPPSSRVLNFLMKEKSKKVLRE